MSNKISLFHIIVTDYPKLGIDNQKKNLNDFAGPEMPSWVNEGPVYELYVRAFSNSGTFKEVEKCLTYLKDLGIKTIWLMPVHPIGEKGRKGNLGSPYAIKDYYKINPEYGTEKDLKYLIDSVHQKNMSIILDIVANHTANDHIKVKNSPELFLKDSEGKFTRKRSEWLDVTDLDYNNKRTWDYMKSVMKYWIEKFELDGFRCDVAGLVPVKFWNEAVDELRQIKPDIYMLAEWESPDMHVSAFHSTYDWTLYYLVKDVYNSKKPASIIIDWILEKQSFYPKNAMPLRFLENHDLERSGKVFGKDSFKPFAALIFSIYGIPLIYAGQEIGEVNKPSHIEKEEIAWLNKDEEIFKFYQDLICLRYNNPVLSSKDLIFLNNNHLDQVLSYLKKDNKNEIIVIINFSNSDLLIQLEGSKRFLHGEYLDLIQNKRIAKEELFSGNLNVKPFQSLYLKKENNKK